ncbi:hypothetical protein AJ80_03699 [Polytolypa hystricis UAMH7299]|uniref:Uncharacterized protein n=1 Tax=Polytolypa hystricis (strain UAMH7299) TaxID=1447883 RepID=A0A2B7YG49_POLH7|nr:hypothetical protein AJ80_03699 [Polytolypa hystricis UAMH7299]
MEQHERVRLKKFYELASRKFNPAIPKAMDAMRDDADPTSFIFHLVGRTSIVGLVPLRELLIQIYEKWGFISSKYDLDIPCPISFTEAEISRYREIAQKYAEAYMEYDGLLTALGGKDGWVSHEEFEEAMARFKVHEASLDGLRKRVQESLCHSSE